MRTGLLFKGRFVPYLCSVMTQGTHPDGHEREAKESFLPELLSLTSVGVNLGSTPHLRQATHTVERNNETMAIPYSLAVRSAIPGKPELGNKTYAVAQYAQVLELDDIAGHMSSHDSKYNKGDVMAVLTQMSDCIREQLLLGNKVVLGDLGAFSLGLSGEGADNAESFSTSMIKMVKVRWNPSSQFANLLKDAEFRFVGTRESQIIARREERKRLNGMASVKPDTSNPGDQNPDKNPDEGGELGE